MQVLLTQDEYRALTEQKSLRETVQAGQLQELCTKIAITMPIVCPWRPDETPEPWGCILDKNNHPGYCDECPVRKICPYDCKEWSK